MSDQFNVATSPNPTGINAPSSGSYGVNAAADRLKASLPSPPAQPSDRQATAPTPPSQVAGQPIPPGPTRNAPGGLPAGLMAPTSRPSTPVSTPLAVDQPNPVVSAPDDKSRRLAILDALSRDPNTSAVTREWAAVVIKNLVSASAR